MYLKIEKTLGISAEEVLAKHHNLWLGVSTSPWFNRPGNLELLVEWAFTHSREKLLIVIPGRMYAANINHVQKKSRARALRDGYALEEEYKDRVAEVMGAKDPDEWGRVEYADYDAVLSPTFVRRRSLFYRAFAEQGSFYERLMEISRDFLLSRGRTITRERTEAAAVYQLQELPMFMGPLQTIDGDTAYVANVYPGIGKFDQLVRDIVEGHVFPRLTDKLRLDTVEGFGTVSVALTEKE